MLRLCVKAEINKQQCLELKASFKKKQLSSLSPCERNNKQSAKGNKQDNARRQTKFRPQVSHGALDPFLKNNEGTKGRWSSGLSYKLHFTFGQRQRSFHIKASEIQFFKKIPPHGYKLELWKETSPFNIHLIKSLIPLVSEEDIWEPKVLLKHLGYKKVIEIKFCKCCPLYPPSELPSNEDFKNPKEKL